MATDIMEFMPNIASAVDQCPTAVIRDKIIESARRFCWKTGLWVERLEAQNVVANQAEYDLKADSILLYDGITQANTVGQVTMAEHAELQNIDLETTSRRYLDENERGWRQYTEGRPRRFYMEPDRKLRLVYIPSQDLTAALDIWVSLMPLRTATTLEDFIWDDWRLLIEWGALALLFETPGVPWGAPDAAAFYWQKWEREMDEAYDRKEQGYIDHQAQYFFRPDYRYF